jgi:signal peptidase I
MVGTRVVGPDGRVPGWKRAVVRGIVSFVADLLANTCGIGILDPLWLLWDRQRQTLHDKAAATIVMVARPRRPVVMLVLSLALMAGSQVGLVFAVIRPFIVQAYYVPSASMHYTLMENDRLLVNKLSYRYGELQRRDIVVFRPPDYVYEQGPTARKRDDFIKRLIALPGDTVEVKDRRLFIDGHTVEEPYLAERRITYAWGPVTVPTGHVLVFGDNRNNSNDSHAWTDSAKPAPFLPIENIRGRAFYRFWPLGRRGDLTGGEQWTTEEAR